MLIGLMSDTHDCLPLIRKAVKVMNDREVELVLHAGDFVAPFVVRELHALQAPFIGVFGNNDGDPTLLKKKIAEKEGFEIRGSFAALSLPCCRVALLHGQDPELLDALTRGNTFDLVVHGHSHTKSMVRREKTRMVNPGEVCAYLTGVGSVAVYDTCKGEAAFIDLADEARPTRSPG